MIHNFTMTTLEINVLLNKELHIKTFEFRSLYQKQPNGSSYFHYEYTQPIIIIIKNRWLRQEQPFGCSLNLFIRWLRQELPSGNSLY